MDHPYVLCPQLPSKRAKIFQSDRPFVVETCAPSYDEYLIIVTQIDQVTNSLNYSKLETSPDVADPQIIITNIAHSSVGRGPPEHIAGSSHVGLNIKSGLCH